MPISALTGTRLRERRLALGLRQADVAQAAGVSASYLNLIEHNRRRVTVEVLEALSGVLGLPAAALQDGAGGALLEDLRAAAARAGAGGGAGAGAGAAGGAELDRVEEFAGRFPGWAAVVVALERRAAGLERAVEALNDRMTHDPHLSASLHEVLSAVSSVRSTAEILAEPGEIAPAWRERFLRNLFADSERLAAGSEALVAYLDGAGQEGLQGIVSPQEEFEAWLAGRGWHLPELEPDVGARDGVAAGEAADAEPDGVRALSAAARVLAAAWLERAAGEARALPLAVLQTAGAGVAEPPDPVLLARQAGISVVAVLRRLALMPGSAAGLVLCDGSGTLTFRKPAEGFAVPRFGAACPLWPLFAALARPGSPVLWDVVTAGRGARRFRALAWCDLRHPDGVGGVELREAGMLIWPLGGGAGALGGRALEVGTSCRICARGGCPARREPSIVGDIG
ncbi:helix-turn-helix transcriptional regulator [Paragemmobacter ruber]|uniref:Helix-turn-helix domain-containing protein n=1 Tax=Paragemmobacter ruber TaxID=1985673 RepID=A0ABW9Y861_9RHOB|nr:helix-turn-helix transcriptional regulator [Rhodobacter ruber]NBE08773.1 helix-turn-helix domain-containing protein [Rhodobacter ruber]